MSIIGWVRYGDTAACGGTVAEGDHTCIGFGRAYSFQGARMACNKQCIITQGDDHTTLPNGRSRVLHGMLTSAGCQLQSSLNDIDGLENVGNQRIYSAFVPSQNGKWKSINPPEQQHDRQYDEYFILMDEKTGAPARNRFYRITLSSGEIIEGYTDKEGRTHYAISDQPVDLRLEIAPQHDIQVGD